MLTLPDFKEKKIVFLQAEKDIDNQIRFHNSNIRLYKKGEFVNQISCYMVLSLFIVGNVTITSTLIQKAKKYGISIFLLNNSFKQYAEIQSVAEGNYALRTVQYTMKVEKELEYSKYIVRNKISNQSQILKHYNHDYIQEEQKAYQRLTKAKNNQEILGVEGNFANFYFQTVFNTLNWNRRAPQTREDIPNFLMDIGYTYLFNYVDSLLKLFGFDTYKGFYHKLFFQRKSLSCDMMEPFRPLIDKAIIKYYNLGKINHNDFLFKNGSFQFKSDPKLRSKYSLMFFDVITDHKEDIYTYLRRFYLHVMNPAKYKFPEYILV